MRRSSFRLYTQRLATQWLQQELQLLSKSDPVKFLTPVVICPRVTLLLYYSQSLLLAFNTTVVPSPSRCYQRRRLSLDQDVHAAQKHRGQAAAFYQVRVLCICTLIFTPVGIVFNLISCLIIYSPLLLQRSNGRPGYTASGQDRGVEEDG